jgi:hypothetical protein
MKLNILIALGLSMLHAEDFLPEKLKAVTYKEIDSFEEDLLRYFKKLSPKEKQDKYLLAGRYFSQVGESDKSFYILEKGIFFEKPETEYLLEFFSLMDHLHKKTEIQEYFSKIIKPHRFRSGNHDDLLEVILIYLKNTRTLSGALKEDFLKDAIRKSTSSSRIRWIDSITLARQNSFKESLEVIKEVKAFGEEENIYVSYLQKKNNLLPRYCTKVQTFSELSERSSYKKSCLILLTENQKIEEKLKDTSEISEHTPLYEVLF